jgi:hypothetical protein
LIEEEELEELCEGLNEEVRTKKSDLSSEERFKIRKILEKQAQKKESTSSCKFISDYSFWEAKLSEITNFK